MTNVLDKPYEITLLINSGNIHYKTVLYSMGWLWLIRSLFKWQTKWVLALCEICLHVDWEVLREWKKPFNRSGKASQKKTCCTQTVHSRHEVFLQVTWKSAINWSMMCFYLATNASIVLVKNWEMVDFNPTFWVLLIQHCNSKKEMRLFWVVLLDHNPRDKFWKNQIFHINSLEDISLRERSDMKTVSFDLKEVNFQ